MIESKDIPWADVHVIADWLEKNNGSSPHERAVQMMKIAEEIGEYVEAMHEDKPSELCDVALTALVALRGWTRRPEDVFLVAAETAASMARYEDPFVAYGKLCAVYIGHLGQNPRKGVTHTIADVTFALADVALAALYLLSLRVIDSQQVFRTHLAKVVRRSTEKKGA